MKEFIIRRYRPDSSPTAERSTVLRIDDEGRILFADHHAEAILGYDSGELEGQSVHRILASREDDPFAPANRHRIERGQTVLVTFRHKEGFFYTASLNLRLEMRDADNAASATIALSDTPGRDARLLRAAESGAGFGLWELDTETNQMTWSEGMFHLLELRPGTGITPEQALFYCQTGQTRVRALFRRCIRTGQGFSLDLDILTSRQNPRRVSLNCRALKASGRTTRLGGTLVDKTARMQLDRVRRQADRILSAISSASRDLVVAVDAAFNLTHFNSAWATQFQETFGVEPTLGANLSRLLESFPNERRMMERLWHRAFERDSFVLEMPMAQQARPLPVYEFHYQRLLGDHGEITGAVHVARPVEPRANQGASDDYRLRHDPVTGLMNRRELVARLLRTLEQKAHRASCDSLLYLDLDNFERFNEQAGSGTCYRYLRELAGNLGVRVRQRDALARLAGDTFALLIENCPEPRARAIAEETLELIGDFVFDWQGHKLSTTASGGLLIMDQDVPTDPEQLLAQAADLCHTAKTSGRNRVHTARALAHQTNDAVANERVAQMRKALDSHNLILEYQAMRPVASPTWGDHIEILCRIPAASDTDEVLMPQDFLPVAERFDLAKRLDRQVIRQTLEWLGRQPLLEPRLKYCGFNLSLASVMDDTFAEFMAGALSGSAFAPDCFCLEIREAHATQYPDDVAVLCDALHKAGFRVALDGAGASVESYSLAARLPVDIIKLDRRMVQHLEDDPVQQVMLEALHRIAEAAGKVTVATFIESDDALRKVRTLGIHYGQGYRLCRPQPLAELTPAAVDLATGRIGG